MIYLDNAATSWPKPPEVNLAITDCLVNYCANPGRSGHKMALQSEKAVFDCRSLISKFFGLNNPLNVVFTLNATMALNIVIKGILKEGKHAIVTSMEHNSVMRPLASSGAMYDVLMADKSGYVNPDDVESLIKNNTSLIICTLSSNVCGSVQPFEKIAEIAKKHGIPFLLDASQGAGAYPIDIGKMNIDFLVCPGHKGLLGPQGTGILCVNSQLRPETIFEGGTGSESKLLMQPDFMPDRFESGTVNVPGIVGLSKGVEYINKRTPEGILYHENKLCNILAQNLAQIPGVRLVGYDPLKPRTAVLSFVMDNKDSLVLASLLNIQYNIALRAGYHCAYTAHSTIGTKNTGTVRVSFGPYNTIKDVDRLTLAVKEISLQN